MQITTLGALAVDGHPVRGDQARRTHRRAARCARACRVVDDARRGRVGRHPARRRRRCGAGAGLPGAPAGLSVTGAPGGYRLPVEDLEIDVARPRACCEGARAAIRDGDPATAHTLTGEARALVPTVPDLRIPRPRTCSVRSSPCVRRAGWRSARPRTWSTTCAAAPGHATRRAGRRAARAGARRAGPRRRGARAGGAGAYRARRPVRHGPVAGGRAGPSRAAARRAARHRPPRSRAPARSVLPGPWRRPATALVGRDEDVAELEAARGGAPGDVVATGGAGKTRLADRGRPAGSPGPPCGSSSWRGCGRRTRCCRRCSRFSAAGRDRGR